MKGKIALVLVLGFGGWLIMDVINERNELKEENISFKNQITACVKEQNSLAKSLSKVNKKTNRLKQINKELEQESIALSEKFKKRNKSLESELEKLKNQPIGDSCEENMDYMQSYFQ